jgi:sodium/hydrogen antiporter
LCLCLGVPPISTKLTCSGWFTRKTEESHVSNVIDLLFNLSFFVYFGAIIPWDMMNAPELTVVPWRLVVIAILILLFRRIPIMLAFKPVISDIRTWREALFSGHFGPIGVGAIFISILARAELETGHTTPLQNLPTDPTSPNYVLILAIWPIVSFLILSSVLPCNTF